MIYHLHTRPEWRRSGLFLLLAGLILTAGCKKESVEKVIPKIENQQADESETQLARQAGDLLSLQEEIREAPALVELRQRYLALALNPARGTIRAVGMSRVPDNPDNRAAVQQSSERAAFLDACRWIAYLLAWNRNVQQPDFGRIQGQVPGARIVYKHVAVDQIVVMVESDVK